MKKNKMEVQLRSYYRPGRSFNTLSNPSPKFKGNRKNIVCNLKTKSGKFQKALNAQMICSFPVIYDMKPSRGIEVPVSLFPPPPPHQNKDKLVPKKMKICFLMFWCSPILHLFAPHPSKFPFCSPIPMKYNCIFSSVTIPRRTSVSDIQIVIDHPGIFLRVCGVGVQTQLTSFDRKDYFNPQLT